MTWARVGLGGYCLLVAVVLLHPSGSVPSSSLTWLTDLTEDLGGPDWLLAPGRMDIATNVLISVPVAVLGSLGWPSTTWRDWTAYVFAVSAAAETVQALLLSERSGTFSDVAANTLGALLGGLATRLLRRRVEPPLGSRT